MEKGFLIAAACACALISSTPTIFMFERALRQGKGASSQNLSIDAGLLSILASLLVLTALTFFVHSWTKGEATLLFGCVEAGTLLIVWGAESIRVFCDIRRESSEGNDEK